LTLTFFGVIGGVCRDPALALGAREDAAEQHERLLRRLVRERLGVALVALPPAAPRRGEQLVTQPVDVGSCDVRDRRRLAERG
jgi:hypothetical protein